MNKRNINNATIESSTSRAKRTVQHVKDKHFKLTVDPERTKRLESQQCGICYYYSGRIGGAACRTIPCGLCEELLHFGSTCVDVLCRDCAIEYNLCLHCGGDIDMKQRRKQRF